MNAAECPGTPEDGEVDQGFRSDVRPAVEFGGAVVWAVRAPFRFGGVHGRLIPHSRNIDAKFELWRGLFSWETVCKVGYGVV